MRVDPAPEELALWICQEMQNDKHAKCITSRSLLSGMAKIRESSELDLDAGTSSNLGQSELWPPASKLLRKGKIMPGRYL